MEQNTKGRILFIVGTVAVIAGLIYLASEYVRYLSELGKLGAIVLLVGIFGALGKYFEQEGR